MKYLPSVVMNIQIVSGLGALRGRGIGFANRCVEFNDLEFIILALLYDPWVL